VKYTDWVELVLQAVIEVDAEVPHGRSWGLGQVITKLRVDGEHAEEATYERPS
jgi:hypothetical protein